ncbi:hypothetical protein IFT68_00600 [Oxalobacteraceae sp. CFBP 13730]|nr:hypothetical protein [Oxalobacteraceae sp. CFBP 13730]
MAVAQLVIFAGQSQCNSNGTSNAQTVPSAISGPMSDVFIWDPFGKAWVTYQAQVTSAVHLKGGKYPDTSQNYFGAEAEYARRWTVDNPGVPLYMIKKAHSTTSLSQAARTTGRGCWDNNLRDDLFDEAISQIADAKANLTASGKTINIRAMNWTQGENDAGSTLAAANAYGTNLSAFIDALRSSGAIASTTLFIISRIQTSTWANPGPVRAAQQLIGETKPYCRWFSADSVTIDGSDTVHYGPNGVVIHGDLMYEEGMSGTETAKLYASRMTTAPSTDRLTKLASFFDTLISNGLWSGISVMQIYASPTEQAARVNAKNGAVTAVNSGMTFTADQGFTGTSTASFINTGVNPVTGDSKLEPGNVSYAYYVRGNIDTSGVDLGFNSSTTGRSVIVTGAKNPTTANFRLNNSNTSADNTYTGIADVSGLWSMSRKSVGACALYNKGAQVHTTDTVNTDVGESSNSIFLGNRNSGNNTSGVNGTLRQYSMFIAGSGRTAAQEAALSNAVSAYLAAIAEPAADTTAPVMTGEITVSAITTSGAALSCPAATDAVGVAGYEYSIDGGASYTVIPNAARSVVVSGRPAGTAHAVRMRAFDTAGNRATPLSASFTTLAETPAQNAVVASTVAESRRVAFPGGTRVVAFGSVPSARTPNAPYLEAGKWWSEKHPLDERYWVANLTIDLAERGTTAVSVEAIVAGVTVLQQPVIQGKLIPVKLGGFNAATGAVNFCTFRVTCANGERFDRTIWFKQQVGSWSLEKDADDESFFVADISNDLADSNTSASAVLAQPVGVIVLVPAVIQGSLILVKLGGMDTLPPGVNYCDLRIDCANGERFYRTIQFNRVDN